MHEIKKFPESKLAHKYLDGLSGLEIGGSAHNPFGLDTKNVDFTSNETVFKREEIEKLGETLPVDIIAPGDNIPVPSGSQDFVVSSHVLEHFPDPIRALKEWHRVIKKGGYIFIIAPHKERTFDRRNSRTTVLELLERHKTGIFPKAKSNHYSFWITEDIIDLVNAIDLEWKIIDFQDIDDKVGNGFTIVIKKEARDEIKDADINKKIEALKKKTEKEKRSLINVLKLKRASELLENSMREYKKRGLKGIFHRAKYMYKWDKK